MSSEMSSECVECAEPEEEAASPSSSSSPSPPSPPSHPALARLKADGCHLTPEGLETVGLSGDVGDIKNILNKVLDFDLREIGAPAFPEEFCKSGSKCETLEEPIFLQIQKVRNVSAPKANEESKHSPRMLKLVLTDGHASCQAIETEFVSGLSVNTPPGTKVQLKAGPIVCSHGFVFVTPSTIKVLGGNVSHMIEKWELNRSLAKHTRVCVGGDGSPPPWIPFGRPLEGRDLQDEMFKCLQDAVKLCNAEFEAQRKGAIAEAQKLSGAKKVFGGGTKPMLDANVQKIVDAGFTEEQAENALKLTRYNADRALKNLQRNSAEGKKERAAKQSGESGKGKKSRNKDGNDEDGAPSLKPTGKLSLFDFLEDKLPVTPETEKAAKFHETSQHKEEAKYDRSNNERKVQSKNSNRGGKSTNARPPNSHPTGNKFDHTQSQNQSYWQNEGQRNYNYPREERSQHSYNSQPIINEKPPRFQRKQENEIKKQQAMNMSQESPYQTNYQNQMQSNLYNNRKNPVDNRPRGFYNQQTMDNITAATANINLDSQVQNRYNNMPNMQNFLNSYTFPTGKANYAQNFQNDTFKRPNQYQTNDKTQMGMPNGQSINQSFYGNFSDNGQLKNNHSNHDQSDLFNALQQQNNQQDQRNNYNYRGNGFYQSNNIVGFQNPTINEQARKMLTEGCEVNWSIGDRCLAKYWEDNTYYDAEITGVSARTVVVRFLVYGNHEEVLRTDCIPPNSNRQFVRDQGMNRNENNSRPGRFHQPMYVPPAQRKA